MKASVRGFEVIVYDFYERSGIRYADCFIPSLGYRCGFLLDQIEVRGE